MTTAPPANFNTTTALANIQAQLNALVVPSPSALKNRTTAANFQQILAPLQSNHDPNNPGLFEIFQQANANIAWQTAEIANDPDDPGDVIAMTQWLHDVYASYEAIQYLLRVSNTIGFPGPATQFYETVIPEALQWGKVIPYQPIGSPPPIVPPIPAPPPVTTPPPPPPSSPGLPSPPAPPSGPVAPSIWLSAEQTGIAGSGEPNNGITLRAVLGVNSVYIPVFARTSTGTSTDCFWLDDDNNPTIVGGMIDLWVAAYDASNLAVILALVLDCADGTPRNAFFPTDTPLFLGELNARALELAQGANRNGADAISIAPEIFPYSGTGDTPAQYMSEWKTIVTTARTTFSGDILYQAIPNNAGPLNGAYAMDWSIWSAVGVDIYPPFGTNVTTATIQSYWETAVDPEGTAGYNEPLWGASSWLRLLYNDWKAAGKKIWIYTGLAMQ
jgi:hypothetical protein